MAVPSNPLRLAPEDLESIIERALEEARPGGDPGRGGCQPGYWSFGRRATRGGRNPGASARPQHGNYGVFRAAQGVGQHRRFLPGGRPGHGGQGLQHRPFHRRGRLRGACGRRTHGEIAAQLGSGPSVERSPPIVPSKSPKSCEAAALAFDPRINNSEGASVGTHQGLHVYGNTHGFVGGYPTTSHTLSCVVLAGKGEDMQRDYWYSSSRDWQRIGDPEAIGRESARRTIARLEPRKLSTRRAPVLFVPEIARGLIGHFTAAIRGSSQYRQSSFLLNSVGQQVFPAWFSVAERPHIMKAMGSAPFDDEGVATKRSRTGRRRGAHGIHPVELFGAQAGASDHRQCRRRAQS
jgi:hypothetical protein